MLDKMSDASRLVDRLIVKKLAKKNTCKEDRRLVDVVITEVGLALLENLDSFSTTIDGLFSHFTPEETKQLNFLLDKIRVKPTETDQNQ
jgi:DNA-binding MarR family transcriptional regulator